MEQKQGGNFDLGWGLICDLVAQVDHDLERELEHDQQGADDLYLNWHYHQGYQFVYPLK